MNTNTIDPRWKDLYTISGITAVMIEIILILTIFAVFIWPPYSPDSDSTESILMLLHNQPWAGLMKLDLLLFVGNLLGIPIFLALYVALKEVNESYALIALVLGLIGISWIVPARPLSELLSLSDLYATATTEVAKVQYLAAAETFLASFNGTGWFLNTLLGGITYLISSFLMLRSSAFSKATAYVGIVSNVAVFCFFIPVIGMPLLFLSVPGYLIWFFQLARTFFKMGRSR